MKNARATMNKIFPWNAIVYEATQLEEMYNKITHIRIYINSKL